MTNISTDMPELFDHDKKYAKKNMWFLSKIISQKQHFKTYAFNFPCCQVHKVVVVVVNFFLFDQFF